MADVASRDLTMSHTVSFLLLWKCPVIEREIGLGMTDVIHQSLT